MVGCSNVFQRFCQRFCQQFSLRNREEVAENRTKGWLWARVRWGGWQTWLVGGPLVLAALWGVSSTAIQLLPNLL